MTMGQATISETIAIGGRSLQSNISRTAEGEIAQPSLALNTGKSGTLSTRTDNDTGVITLAEGHGITALDVVDVYWSGGLRYGMTVSDPQATTIAVDVGAGDNLPTQGAAVIVCVRKSVAMPLDGDLLTVLAVQAAQRASVVFLDESSTVLLALDLTAGEAYRWVSGQGTNPLAGVVVATVGVSSGSTSANELTVLVLYDSVS
jgi:hypothetical protein